MRASAHGNFPSHDMTANKVNLNSQRRVALETPAEDERPAFAVVLKADELGSRTKARERGFRARVVAGLDH